MGRLGFRFRNKLYVFMAAITTAIISLLITSRYLGGNGKLVLWSVFILLMPLLIESTENYGREMTLYNKKNQELIKLTRSTLALYLNYLQGNHAVVRSIQGLQYYTCQSQRS